MQGSSSVFLHLLMLLSQLYHYGDQLGNSCGQRKKKKRKALNIDKLIIALEEIEDDAILSKALTSNEVGESSNKSHVSCS